MLDRPDDDDAPLRVAPAVYSWNASQDRWSAEAEINTPRYLHGTIRLDSGDLLIVGGLTDGKPSADDASALTTLASVERRRPDGTWSPRAPLPRPLAEPTVTLLADGKVLACGGYDDGVTSFTAVYDPPSNRWEEVSQMAHPRAGHRAVRLADGRVLVVGGAAAFDAPAVEAAEVWDPTRGTWTTIQGPQQPRLGHTVTTLADGRILVAGGSSEGELLGAAELWHAN